jgi:hypothetical protein
MRSISPWVYRTPGSLSAALVASCICLLSSLASSQVQVATEHNDASRTGANLNETILTRANVNSNLFGKLFVQTVDGYVVGQPLYLSSVKFPDGSTHDVVYVVTQHDSVFAFDGDSYQAPLWSVSFIDPAAGITTVPMSLSDYGCTGTAFKEIGIVSTPVIDPAAGTLFVVAKTLENGAFVYRLHALSVTTGADVIPPVVISASIATNNGTLQFNSAIQMQRPALLLENGTIYIGFGSNGCDVYSYHGWLLAYSEATLQPVGAYVDTPEGQKGAIWQAGGGPAADSDGSIFLATANGTFDGNTGGSDYGDSLIHLRPADAGLTLLDSFTPYDQEAMFENDLDLGSGGVVVLPDQSGPYQHEMVGGGKEGTLYLVNRDGMGGYNPSGNTQIIQSIPNASSGELDSVPAYWNGNVYITGLKDYTKAFSLSNGLLSLQPTSQTSVLTGLGGISVTASGSNNGILWDIQGSSPAIFYAFDATDLGTELYGSNQAKSSRDKLGSVPRFAVPTVANGKAYIGGWTALTVYGLLPLISPVTGNNQSAYVGTTLPVPLQLQTVDAYLGNPIANASVTCKDGGVLGTFGASMPMVTNSQGQASTTYTLPKKSQNITITCTAGGFVSGTFSEVAVAGPPSTQVILSGNYQTGPVDTQLPSPFVLQVRDQYHYGIPGLTVIFSDGGAGGSFSSASVTTDSLGNATTFYTTPNTSGKVTVTASTPGLNPSDFKVTVN